MRGREADLDAAIEPAVARRLQNRGATTALALPIGGAARPVGVLEILRAGPDPFSEAERQLLRHVAAQAALAVSRAGSGVDTGLPELLDIAGEALSATGDGAAVARVAARLASSACRADSALLHAVDEDGLHVLAGFGARLADPLRQGPLDALALEALRHDDAIVTGGDGSAALAGGVGSGAVLSVVLRARGESLGVLQLLFGERERADAASADVALTVFATRIAEALASARSQHRLTVDLADARALCDAVAPAGEPSTQRALEAALRLTGLSRAGSGRGPRTARCARSRAPAAGRRRPRSWRRCSTRPAALPPCAETSHPTPASRRSARGRCRQRGHHPPRAARPRRRGARALSSASTPPAGAAEVALRVAGVTPAVLAADEHAGSPSRRRAGPGERDHPRSVAVRLEAHEALADAALEGGDPEARSRRRPRASPPSRPAPSSASAPMGRSARRPARRGQRAARARRPRPRAPARRLHRGRRPRPRGEVVVLDADDAEPGRWHRSSSRGRPPRSSRSARPAHPRRGRDGLARSDAARDGRGRAGGAPARLALSRAIAVSVIAGALRREMQHCSRALVAPTPRRRCGARLRRASGAAYAASSEDASPLPTA